MAIDDIPQCGCLTCKDPRAAMIADLREQCCCDERVCAPCRAVGTLTGFYRCDHCREWTAAERMNHPAGADQSLCDGCYEERHPEAWGPEGDR